MPLLQLPPLVAMFTLLVPVGSKPTLRLGVSGPDLCMGYHMTGMARAAQLAWEARWAPLMPESPSDFDVAVYAVNSFCTPGSSFNTLLGLMQPSQERPPVHAFVGEMITPVCQVSGRLTSAFLTPHVASACVGGALRDRAAYPTFTTMMPPNINCVRIIVRMLNQLQQRAGEEIRKISVFFTDEGLGRGALNNALGFLQSEGLANASVNYISLVFNPDIDPSFWQDAFDKARVVNSHVNLIAVQASIAPMVLSAIADAGLTGAEKIWFDLIGTTAAVPNPNFAGQLITNQSPRAPNFNAAFSDFWLSLSRDNFTHVQEGYYDGAHSVGPLAGTPKIPDALFEGAVLERDRYAQETVAHNTFDAVIMFIHLFDKHIKSAGPDDDPEATFRSAPVVQNLMRSTAVEGITGRIEWDDNLDRVAEFSIFNRRPDGRTAVIGTVRMPSLEITIDGEWYFGDGTTAIPTLNPPPCPRGFFVHGDTGVCTACPEGSFGATIDAMQCTQCSPGSFTNQSGQSACVFCERGSAQEAAGETGCAMCTAGHIAGDRGTPQCDECPPGRAAGADGMTACELCVTGRFAAGSGRTTCESCAANRTNGELYTTLRLVRVRGEDEWTPFEGAASSDACGCDRGAQRVSSEACVPCGAGLRCLGMGDVMIEAGYAWDNELSVYKCYGDSRRCPGGLPGTCARGRRAASIACVECEVGMTPDSEGGCKECAGSDAGPFVLTAAALLLLLCLGYCVVDRQKRGLPNMTLVFVAILFAQVATLIQQMGVVGMISVQWQEPFSALLEVTMLFNIDIEVLHPECVATLNPLTKYAGRVLFIFAGIVSICVLHAVCVCAFHGGRFKERTPTLVASVGSLLLLFFLPIISTMLSPFLCQKHPNEHQTLTAYPTVTCWQGGSHTSMLVVGFCSLLLPIGFLCVAAWVIEAFPRRMLAGDARFLRSWGFFVYRYKVTSYWYALVILARNAFIAVGPVLYNPLLQIMWLQVALLVSLVLLMYFQPWRLWIANLIDAFGHSCMLVLACFACLFIDDLDMGFASNMALGVAIAAFAMLPVSVVVAMAHFARKMQKPFQFFICHHKAGAGSFARCLKMYLRSTKGVSRKVFIDSDDLQDLDTLFDIVGYQTETLVVVCSADVLTRPWCAGEIATARIRNVRAAPVMYPDVAKPSDEFIADYSIHVPDVSCLCERNITLEMVQEALYWLRDLSCISLPAISGVYVKALAEQLASHPARSPGKAALLEAGRADPFPADAATAILADPTNTEAVSTAIVLRDMLVPHLASDPAKMPYILPGGCTVSDSAADLMLVCTQGVFQQSSVLDSIATAGRSGGARVIPILGDDAFRFPTPSSLAEQRPIILAKASDPEAAMRLIPEIFREIAVVFQPTHYASTEAVLQQKAREVAARLCQKNSRRLTVAEPGLGAAGAAPANGPLKVTL